MSSALSRQIKEAAIHLHEGRTITEIKGETGVDKIILDNGTEIKVSGIFIELGAKGAIELAGGLGITLDSESMQYIVCVPFPFFFFKIEFHFFHLFLFF